MKQKLLKSNKISAIGLSASETGKKLRLLVCREHRLPCPVSKKTPAGETKAGVSEARFSLEAYSITSGSTALSSLWNFASITFITKSPSFSSSPTTDEYIVPRANEYL